MDMILTFGLSSIVVFSVLIYVMGVIDRIFK